MGDRAMTTTIATDAPTHVTCAYRWLDHGDVSLAEYHLRQLSAAEMREAYTTLLRTAVIVTALLAEHDMANVAAAVLQPDSLPDNVEGRSIGGGPSRECRWCHRADCTERLVHANLHRLRS